MKTNLRSYLKDSICLKETPYLSTVSKSIKERRKEFTELAKIYNNHYDNFLENNPTTISDDYKFRMLRKRIQNLCRGTVSWTSPLVGPNSQKVAPPKKF